MTTKISFVKIKTPVEGFGKEPTVLAYRGQHNLERALRNGVWSQIRNQIVIENIPEEIAAEAAGIAFPNHHSYGGKFYCYWVRNPIRAGADVFVLGVLHDPKYW